MLDNDTCGVTVQTSIIYEHRDEMFRLIGYITCAPGTGDHNEWADIAQFCRDAFIQQWLTSCFTCCTCWSVAEDNGIKRLIRSCNVDLINSWMLAQITSFCCPSVYDTQVSLLYERLEAFLNEW